MSSIRNNDSYETNNLSIEEKEVNIITSLVEKTEFAKKCYEFDKEFDIS